MLERLYRGSIVNYHTFFQDDYPGEVSLRFATQSIMKELSLQKMEELVLLFPRLKTVFDSFRKQTLLKSKTFPLDFIMVLQKQVTRRLLKKCRDEILAKKADQVDKVVKIENQRRKNIRLDIMDHEQTK